MKGERRPAPAALVLGVLAGVLAAVSVLPTAIPLTLRLSGAEQTLAVRHAMTAAAVVAQLIEEDGSVSPGTRARVQVDYIGVTSDAGLVIYQEGPDLPAEIIATACIAPTASQPLMDRAGIQWAVACVAVPGYSVITAWRPQYGASSEVALLVITLSAIVGIVTALGVLRLLAPLSRVSRALDRVGAGERGVRLPKTGMAELDDLVDRLNAAASSMEEREDAILSRIQVVQQLARLVAHEVRNPLQSLELLTSLIASEDDGDERQALADSIHQEIRALDMVVDRVLRQGVDAGGLRLNRAPSSIRPVIAKVMALRKPEAHANGIDLQVGAIDDTPVMMDPALLGRSIENLVLNAMQAVPPHRGVVRISTASTEDEFLVTVEDNGPGVPEAFGSHIYDPNVSGRTGGTGLGLSLVKGVIDAHGGYISHDRSPDLGGARFRARIPLNEAQGG